MKIIKSWKAILGVLLVAGLVSVVGVQVAAAESRGNQADVIFTKWVTAWNWSSTEAPPTHITNPLVDIADMKGVVSGDVGAGLFKGEVITYETTTIKNAEGKITTPGITRVTADYHIQGKTHKFTARLSVVQDDAKGTAVLKGRVIDDWMKGAKVSGSYQVADLSSASDITNSITEDMAYQGTLHLQLDR